MNTSSVDTLYHPPAHMHAHLHRPLYVKLRSNYYLAEGKLENIARCYSRVQLTLKIQQEETTCARAQAVITGAGLMLVSCFSGVAPWTFLAWMGFHCQSVDCMDCSTRNWEILSTNIQQECERVIQQNNLQPHQLSPEERRKSEIIEIGEASEISTQITSEGSLV